MLTVEYLEKTDKEEIKTHLLPIFPGAVGDNLSIINYESFH